MKRRSPHSYPQLRRVTVKEIRTVRRTTVWKRRERANRKARSPVLEKWKTEKMKKNRKKPERMKNKNEKMKKKEKEFLKMKK